MFFVPWIYENCITDFGFGFGLARGERPQNKILAPHSSHPASRHHYVYDYKK